MNERAKDGRTTSDEDLLVDYAERLERHRTGRRAVQIHLSQLRSYNQRPHHIRVAKQILEPLVQRFDAGVYQLWNNDVVALTKGASEDDIDVYVRHMRQCSKRIRCSRHRPAHRAARRPFAPGTISRPNGKASSSWRANTATIAARPIPPAAAAAKGSGPQMDSVGTTIGPAILEKLEKAIVNADLANVLRRQQVFAIIPGAKPAPILTELFFSMPFLAQTVAPGYNVTADKWLFQHLARVLDARMLALMPRHEYQPMLKNASLNLSLATVLSPEFLDFDKATNNKERGPLAIELPAIDFFSEPEDFCLRPRFPQRAWLQDYSRPGQISAVAADESRPAQCRSRQGHLDAGLLRRLHDDAGREPAEGGRSFRSRTHHPVPGRFRTGPGDRRQARDPAVPGPVAGFHGAGQGLTPPTPANESRRKEPRARAAGENDPFRDRHS